MRGRAKAANGSDTGVPVFVMHRNGNAIPAFYDTVTRFVFKEAA